MARPPVKCHFCKKNFERRDGADLYCSAECERGNDKLEAAIADGLTAAGFVRKPESGSIVWVKDGVAVTTWHARVAGLAEVLKQHGRVVAEIKNRAGENPVAPTPGSK